MRMQRVVLTKVVSCLALLIFLLFPLIAHAQSTWVETGQQFDGTAGHASAPFWPPYNNYSTQAYDPFTGQMLYYGRSQPSGGQIYSTDLLSYSAGSNTWISLASVGTTTSTCSGLGPPSTATVPDTLVRPGTGHPTGNQAYDWRHGYFFLWGRVTCGGTEDTAWLFPTSIDSPFSGASLFSGNCPLAICVNAWSLQLGTVGGATTPFGQWEGAMSYDPVDNYIMGFGGITCTNQTGSCLSLNNFVWKYAPTSNTLSAQCPSATASPICAGQGTYACPGGVGVGCPSPRSGTSFIWDWYHNDRFIVFGGYTGYGANDGCDTPSTHPAGQDAMWWWFPGTGKWQMANYTGTAPSRTCYAWFQTYDTLRDYVWMPDDIGGLDYYDVKNNVWHASGVSGGPGPACKVRPCPNGDPLPANEAQMYYDAWTDQLVVMTGYSAAHQSEHVWTLPLAPSFPPPNIAGNFPTSTTALNLPRPIARPAALGGAYTEPGTGAVVQRATSSSSRGMNGAAIDPASCLYSQTQCWSFDNSYMMLANGNVINAATHATVCRGMTNNINNPVWDPTSDRILGWGEGSNFPRLSYVQFTVPGCVATKLWDFSSSYNTVGCTPGGSNEIHNVSFQDTDSTGTYAVGSGCRISDGVYVLFVLNIKTGVKGVDFPAIHGGGSPATGGCAGPTGPDYAMVDWQAKYVLVEWGPSGSGATGTRFCGMEAFTLSTAASPSGSWNFLGQVVPADDHLDILVDAQGQEWIVSYSDQAGWNNSGVPQFDVVKCKVTGGPFSSSNCVAISPTGSGIGGHLSCHDYKTTNPYCVWSDDVVTGSRQDGVWLPFKSEIVQVFPDSTLSAPHIKRLAHTYTDAPYVENLPALPCGSNASYWTFAKPIIRNDGQEVEFATNFGPSCSSEAFVIKNAGGSTGSGTPPTVSIASPSSGLTVSGTVSLSANATGNGAAIAWVEFDLDGNLLSPVITTAPYSFSWNSSTTTDGSHTLIAVTSDASGNTSTSAPVFVAVSNTSTQPSIAITAPTNGLVVAGTTTVSADVLASAGVASVQFKRDGNNLGAAVTAAPFQTSWDTTTATNGVHFLTAVVKDKANVTVTSNPVVVTISNGGGGTGGGGTAPPPGTSATTGIDSNTKFQVDAQDLTSAVAACVSCSFRSAADLVAGQTTQVQLRTPVSATAPLANVIALRQGALNGTVTSVGTNQFVIQTTDGSPWPSSILVLTSSVTEFLNFSGSPATVQVGQSVAVRGLLFKSGPQSGPTLIARRVQSR